jgi:hypothetical protein
MVSLIDGAILSYQQVYLSSQESLESLFRHQKYREMRQIKPQDVKVLKGLPKLYIGLG